jgi:hypothetical protein
MIKITSHTRPVVWQVDTRFKLPNVTGPVRWNGNTSEFEVCDGSGKWNKIDPTIRLECNEDTAEVIAWARKKMIEEKQLNELAKEYPAVREAKQNLDIILEFVKHDTKQPN